MKRLLVGLLVLGSFSTLACDCVKGFKDNLKERETELIISHLESSSEKIESIKQLSIKSGDNIGTVLGKIVFFPAFVISKFNKCNNICNKRGDSNIRGAAKYLVKYENESREICERFIKIKGSTNYEGTKLDRVRVKNLGETCQ